MQSSVSVSVLLLFSLLISECHFAFVFTPNLAVSLHGRNPRIDSNVVSNILSK